MAARDVVRSGLLLDRDWSELNRLANKRGPKAIQSAFAELATSNPECFSRLVAALSPDGTRELAIKTLLSLVAEVRSAPLSDPKAFGADGSNQSGATGNFGSTAL